MNCTINDLNLSFDKDNRLRSTIGRVSGWNVDKATMLAAQLQSDDFKKFLSKHLTPEDILTDATVDINNIQDIDYINIKQNKFGSLLNYYYLTRYHSIDNTKTNKGMGRLLGFSSSNAKKVAKEYVGDLIIGRYQSELNKPREVRKTNTEVIEEVRRELNDTFIKRADNFADNILATNKYSQEAKDYAQRYKDTIARGKALAAEINNNNSWISSTFAVLKEFTGRELNAAEEQQYRELKKNYDDRLNAQNQRKEAIARIRQDRKIMAYNLMTLFTSNEDAAIGVRNRNFANLVMQVNGNPNEFFFEVYNTKKMTNLIKEYNKTGDIAEYVEDEDVNNDEQDNQFNNQTFDETSKSWEDNLFKNFNSAISTKMKFMLSRIPKLNVPFSSTSNAQAADTNNELGVPLYYDSSYLTLQIFTNADFTNIDSMISSLERKSNQIKSLYGLGGFVNRLKQDRTLANYVYANFAKPIVNKVMVTINDITLADGIAFDYSNPNAFSQVKLAFDMMNKLRATYNTQYNVKDSNTLERLERTKNDDIPKIREEFAQVLTTYFPNFDTTTLNNVFNASNKGEIVRSLVRNLKAIVDGVGKIKDNINAEYDRINKKYDDDCKAYNNTIVKLYQEKVPQHLYPEPPIRDEFDVSKYNLIGTVNQAIIRFANTISEYNESRARLNTANAEGNTASDVIKNCFVTRFFDMILSENENDSNAGLKALRDYLLQGTENGKDNQYSNNPIFFGLKDQYGNAVAGAEGMFTKTPNGAIINPNAKSILKYALFDGVKNANSGIGTVYDKMSKIEFFITQFIAFNNSLEERTENGTTKDVGNLKTAVYPMRIGSDAPKIFMIRAPRYSRTQVEYALFDHFMNEMTMFVQGINNLFTIKDGNFVTKTDVNGLISRAYFNEKTANKIRNSGGTDYTKAIVEDGKLTGKMFKFYRLFQLNGYDFNKQLEDALLLYGGGSEGRPALFATTADGKIILNNDYLKRSESFLVVDGDKVRLNLNNELRDNLINMVHTWAVTYLAESKAEISDYLEALDEQGIHYDDASIDSFLLNSAVMNMNYDDLFEGDFKFYNNPRDFLKRTKETQAGGDAYENSNILDWKNDITELEWNGQPATITVKQTRGGESVPYATPTYRNGTIENDAFMVSRNGWRAVTIYNTVKPADEAQQLQEVLYKQFISEGMDETRAHARSVKIAKGYWDNTTANDAQSYITLEEFIRRKEADGTLDEYQDLLAQLLDPNVSANEINLDEINARIQVQKNFYFDKVFDADTGQFIPRQIKNAEFVLIPKLLPKDSDLIKVYDWMKANDIGQLNTAETDKAAKKNIFAIWNEQTGEFDKDFESKFDIKYIQTYKYKYLYKQQDVPQHMTNEENKLGSQISKKIIDNVSTASKEVQDWANEYQAGYVANIREDFLNFLDSMGWELDSSGKIVNSEYATVDVDGNQLNAETIRSNRETLNLTNYYTRARQEAVRLGMDSNFIEYLIPDEFGKPVMPNAMNNVQQKLESVGQALFNRTITRQTLPGWHAAQITGIGYSKTLRFDAESGIMEVYLPRWDSRIPKGKTPEEDATILKQIQEAGLDIHLGYRIPTEGKQSISVLRVVGFTNEALGSTIVVPDAWVTQTGSDFDVDSIYGICWEMYRKKEKDGTYTVHKVPYKEGETDDRMLYINHVNSRLDSKVKRTDLGEEIDSIVKELKARVRGEQKEAKAKRENLSKLFDEQDKIRNEIYRKHLPVWARGIIMDENKAAKKKAKADGVAVDLTDAYPNIANKLTEYLNKHTLPVEEVNAVQDYLDQQTTLLNIIDAQRGGYRFNKEDYFNEKNTAIQQAIEDNINAWVKNVEVEAAKVDIMSFEEFKALPYVERLNRRARNNYILERMINIMNDASSREEQYGRSQFEGIVNGEDGANDIVDKIAGTTTKLISPYNPLTQLDYFDDAMGGAALKARSVNWDTMASKSNRAHGYLSDEYAVYAVLNVDGESAPNSAITYDEQTVKDAYNEDVSSYDENQKVINDTYEGIEAAYSIQMKQSYGNERRPGVNAINTLDAIRFGERTATTRYFKDGNIAYLSQVKEGDIIKCTGADGRIVMVRVTKPLTKLRKNASAEAWSRKEGWSVEHFNRVVKPEIEKGEAYQIEYEYVAPRSMDAATQEEINRIGKDNIVRTINTLNSDNNELSEAEKKVITEKLGKRPRVLIASEATDPVFHAKQIKQKVEAELAKPAEQRSFHMMYLITKHDGLPFKELAQLKIPKFIHFSITSLGGTKYEPGVMKMDDLLDRIETFIKDGVINPRLVTIRIDPIVPGVTKKEDIRHIMERAKAIGIDQFKFSLMDSYGNYEDRFVVQKMRELGYPWETYYDTITDKNNNQIVEFNPKQEFINDYYSYMDNLAEELGVKVWTCGENPKGVKLKRVRTNVGCVNVDAMNKAMGTTDISYVRGNQRKECSCYGNKTDACNYGASCASSCVYCYAKHNGDATMKYYDENGHLLDNNFTRTSNDVNTEGKTFMVKGVGDEIYDYHLYTGTDYKDNYTKGGDSIFYEISKEFGIKTTGYNPKLIDRLTKEQRDEIEKAYIKASTDLGRPFIPMGGRGATFVRRDYLQAKAGDAVFAIGNIVYPGQRNKDGYRVRAKNPSVDGGTGYAVQMAINMGKPINVFVPTERQWYRYDYTKQDFVKQFVPKLTPKFAGIGTEDVEGNEVVKEYIRQLFTVTRDGLYKKTNQVHDVFNTPTGKKQLLLKANKFGWSNNNKNIVNDYVTTSTAQTTAHHLDAVKRGSIPNVNDYTFDVYKLITCLGLDHEFSVGFMRQPIISRLVANYNLTNSIYFRDSNDPIDMTVADIAKDLNLQYVTETKFGTRANPINKYSNLNESVDALKKDENFVASFKSIFGVDISNMNGNNIFALRFPLRKDYIFQRIRTAGKNKTNKINIEHPTAYNEATVDFATLIQFRQMLATTKKINTIIQFSAVDKIGAKPSNRETRQIRDSINRFRGDTVLMAGNKTWADALFPLDEDGNIDVNASVNPSIAASYAYSTLPSIQVAGQVFVTEQQDFIDAENNIQKIIGRRFTEQEAKEWRRYGMIYLYNGIGKLLEPLMVDERGRIIPFISKIEENDTEPKTANLYWNDERSRIVGYGVTTESNFTVEDINNHTDAELAEYAKLTPAQKVIFIQRNFSDNQSIFNYIKVTLINNTDAKNKGITRQYLSYDDQVDSIEDLFHFFRNSFSNHNPLIKLACVDLIKYAFIAEGFNFRSGYITKTIPNDTLYTDVNQGGMDIINNIDLAHPDNNGVVERLKTLPAELVSEEFIDLFIRSHSEMIKTTRLPNSRYTTDNETGDTIERPGLSKMFKACTRVDGLVVLDNTTENPILRSLINKLNLKRKVNGYVKVDFPIDQTHRDTRLYLVVAGNEFNILNDEKQIIGTDYKDYYLVPLNLLEKYETYDMSYNERYNKFNNFNYYLDICQKLEIATEARRKAKSNAIVSEANRMVIGVKETIGTYRPSTGGVQDAMKVITALTAMANSADHRIADGAKMLTNPISRIMIPRVLGDNYNAMYILNNNRIFAQYLPQGTATTQVVFDVDGNAQEFTIASIPTNHTARKAIKEMIDDVTKIDTKDRQDEYQYIVDQCKDTKTSPFGSIIYRVSPVKKTNEEVSDTIMKAATVTIDPVEDDSVDRADIVGNSARRGMDIDNVSAAIIKQITYDARKNDRDIAIDFVRNIERRGINRNFRSNLIEHRGDIYTAAARYYQSAANAIINRINKYNLLGEDYDMSEETMYEVLSQNPEYFAEVANLILDAVTFGNRIDMIFSLDIATEDKQTKEAIESIIRSINSIRTNTKVRMAMNNLINIYFKRYSTNPMITQGLMNIRDQFGDIDTAVKLIADPAEINNNEVQIILKQIYTMFSQAEMFETRRNVKEWKDAVDEIKKMAESLNMNNVIDFDNFKLLDDFNEDFYKDKTKVIDDYKQTKQHRFDNIDAYDNYLKAQYARDDFMYKYTEQPIISDYYKEDLENRTFVMERAGKLYSEYRMLTAKLYEQKDILENNEIETIKARIRELKSITDVVGAEKAPHLKIAAEAINDYIDKRNEIIKKYFDNHEYDGFQETYQKYSSFIKTYDKRHSEKTIDEKLENAEYREAFEWIKTNGHERFTEEATEKLSNAFEKLIDRKTAISTKTKLRLKGVEGAIDESGTINPMALSDEQIQILKEEEETELAVKYNNGDGEMILIRDVPKNIPLRFRKKTAIKYKQDPDKARTIGRINQIISKAVNHDTSHIDIPTLFNNEYVTDAEREELARLYEHLYALGVGFGEDNGVSYSLEYNREAYDAAMNYYNNNLRNTKQGKQFLRIVTHMTVDGQLLPNTYMYGYKLPFEEFIDSERTDAFNFIQDNVEFVPTEYYYQALKKASEEGRYDEWFELNHVYNPYSHKYEPLKIWTRMQAKPNSELAKSVEYIPSFDNMERSVKSEYINNAENRKRLGLNGEGYQEFSSNYKKGNNKYDSTIKRNVKEQAMYKLIQKTLNKYATTYQGKRFVGQGYLPRERETQVNGRWALGQIAALFGASWHSGADSDSFHETVDYSHDREAEMKMLQLLKDKGSKKYKKLPNRADFKTDEDYQKELEKVREENAKIAEDNRKIDKGLVNKDVFKVMEDFVYNATIFNSRQAAKPYLYLLLEDLAVNNAYMLKGKWNKHLVKDLDTSTRDDTQYRRVQQNNARELVHNLARRLIYSQYHDTGAMRTVANFMQNLTSAKFMIFNLYGGVSNVATGKINIAMEELANEYFGFKEMRRAERKYLSNSTAFVSSMFTEKAPNLIVALCKQFKVVDFDQVLQFGATSDNLDARMRTVRNFMYSFQSMGEHYMQNSVALAMLESNRLYTDSEGNIRIGDFKDFTWDVESRAMHDVLAAYPDLLMGYKAYKESIAKYSVEQRLELSMGHKDLNRNFLYSLRDNIDENVNALYRKIAKVYHKRREELMKEAKEQFVVNPTIYSLYEFKDGEAVLTAEAIAKLKGKSKEPERELETLIAGLREKIKAVNKKIHGVYDKNGAALIESKWWGSLVMQYHKHLPMGIWKRWRRKGYYSEFRGSMERGTYQTLIDFIGTEFTNFKTRSGQLQENGTGMAFASIQVAIESLVNTFMNIQFNWNNLSNWERSNIKRNIAEIAGVFTACLIVFALYGLSDDDDINDDRFKASLLYLADRLYSETTTYSPIGMISEYRTNLRNPIAAMQSVTDLMKAAVMIPQYLFDPSFEVEYQNGRYAGENKFDVLLKRNTAGFRNFDRIMTIDKNNSYYKVGKSQIGINIAKSFGDIVAGRDNE